MVAAADKNGLLAAAVLSGFAALYVSPPPLEAVCVGVQPSFLPNALLIRRSRPCHVGAIEGASATGCGARARRSR